MFIYSMANMKRNSFRVGGSCSLF